MCLTVIQIGHDELGAMTEHDRDRRLSADAETEALAAELSLHVQRIQNVGIFPKLSVEAELPTQFVAGPPLEPVLTELVRIRQLGNW